MASNALSTSGRKSNRRAFMLAGVFGLLSAVLVLVYLTDARKGDSTAIATAPAVFAVREIPPRTPITDGMLVVKQVPVDARHPLALEEISGARGQITRVPIAAGEQVLRTKIADQVRDVGFSAAIPEGKRAVAVGVTEVVASGGLLAPGDNVDVIGLFEVYVEKDGLSAGRRSSNNPWDTAGRDQGDKPKVFTAVTILQNVQVLAVAKNSDVTLESGADAKKKSSGRPEDAKSVTLAVTPEQAAKITLAEEIGKIRLALRPFGDTEQRRITPATNSLEELVGP